MSAFLSPSKSKAVPGAAPVSSTGQCISDGAFYHNSRNGFHDFTDGMSSTFFVGERKSFPSAPFYSTWVGSVPEGEESFARILGVFDHTPNHPAAHLEDFSSTHVGGAQFVLADGHVKFVSENIDGEVYLAAALAWTMGSLLVLGRRYQSIQV